MVKRLTTFLFLLFCFISYSFSQYTVTGTVMDSDNYPLIGVSIVEANTSNGTVTDIDGKYTLQVESENSILNFNYLGYSTVEILATAAQATVVEMLTSAEQLEEIVVVGYGTQKKKVVTGAISKITSSSLEDVPVVRVESTLQGRTSGVRVTMGSGQPGDGGQVRIRGTTNINGGDPLYVVDGIPIGGGIDFLNQGDIESIEVLKDASAAIYGARSSGGVILITTKKGSAGKMALNYSGYTGVQAPWKKLSLLNGTEYATLMNESSVAAGGQVLFDDPSIFGEGTDWQSTVFNEQAQMTNHELSLTAGSDRSTYYASAGYFDQEGIVSDNQSNFKRFTARLNSNHKITDRIRIGNTLAYTNIQSQGVATNTEFGSPLSRAINLDPLTPLLETRPEVLESSVFTNFPVVTNDEGIPYGISNFVTSEVLNPVAALRTQQGSGYSHKIVARVFGELDLLDGLTYRSSAGSDVAFWGGEGFTPIHYLNAANRNDITRYNRNQNRGFYWILENTLSYNKTFGGHTLGLLGGVVAENNAGQGISGNVNNIPVTSIEDASLGFAVSADDQTFGGYEYQDRSASYISRINYNYNQKYLFTALMRVDGSAKFGPNNKFGYFPAISAGWVVTEENFLSNNKIINFLKLRGSWGINGNNNIGFFRYVSTVGGGRNFVFGLDDQLTNGVSPNAISNPDLKWESTYQTNIGFDANIFRGFKVTMDAYRKNTVDMLLDVAVPGYVGNAGPVGNIASMINRGIELELGYGNTRGVFTYDVSGNISYNQNEVTFLGNDKEFLPGQTFSPQALEITRISEGLPIGYLFGFETDGIFQNQGEVDAYTGAEGALLQPDASPGDFRFVDTNGDGVLDNDDRTVIGDPTPKWTYGMNVNLGYKGFDLVLFGQGVHDVDVYQATRRFDLQMANLQADALGRWTGEGTTNEYPRLVMNDPNRNFSRSSDFYVEDASFFRIRNLQIGYTFGEKLAKRIGLTNTRIYVSGNNLLTFTNYSGYDPEVLNGVDRGLYPQPRFFLVGINTGI